VFPPEKDNKKIVNAWAFYDWANSVFPLVITAAIFPPFYESATVNAFGSDQVEFLGFSIKNSVLYSYAFSFSFLITAILSPVLSGIADYSGQKKSYMRFFVTLGALACLCLFFFNGSNLLLGIGCIILGNIGFNGSLVFYNAYLPEIVSESKRDRVSAKGFSLGYFGGFLLLVLNLMFISNAEKIGFNDKTLAGQISFLTVGLWWLWFAQDSFYYLPSGYLKSVKSENYLINGFKELKKVFFQLKEMHDLKVFLSAFFIYSMGVQTVLYMAALFGAKELNVPTEKLIISILLIQLVAMIGARLAALLSEKTTNIHAISIILAGWVVMCITAFFTYKANGFFVLAFMVGLVMGGIQSLSRSTYSKLIPENTKDTASFFSFYEFTEKIAIVLGIAAYGFIEQISGSMRNSVILLGLFFITGFLILLFTKKHKKGLLS